MALKSLKRSFDHNYLPSSSPLPRVNSSINEPLSPLLDRSLLSPLSQPSSSDDLPDIHPHSRDSNSNSSHCIPSLYLPSCYYHSFRNCHFSTSNSLHVPPSPIETLASIALATSPSYSLFTESLPTSRSPPHSTRGRPLSWEHPTLHSCSICSSHYPLLPPHPPPTLPLSYSSTKLPPLEPPYKRPRRECSPCSSPATATACPFHQSHLSSHPSSQSNLQDPSLHRSSTLQLSHRNTEDLFVGNILLSLFSSSNNPACSSPEPIDPNTPRFYDSSHLSLDLPPSSNANTLNTFQNHTDPSSDLTFSSLPNLSQPVFSQNSHFTTSPRAYINNYPVNFTSRHPKVTDSYLSSYPSVTDLSTYSAPIVSQTSKTSALSSTGAGRCHQPLNSSPLLFSHSLHSSTKLSSPHFSRLAPNSTAPFLTHLKPVKSEESSSILHSKTFYHNLLPRNVMPDSKLEISQDINPPRRLSCPSLPLSNNPVYQRATSAPPGLTFPIIETTAPQIYDDQNAVCRVCKSSDDSHTRESQCWVECSGCFNWYHLTCAGFKTEQEVSRVDNFFCKFCQPLHGPTTYFPNSRVKHSNDDFTDPCGDACNSSTVDFEHPYVKFFKNDRTNFAPDNYPRLPPECVTAEYFEKCGGLKYPVIIPAEWNPRPTLPSAQCASPPSDYNQVDNNAKGPEIVKERRKQHCEDVFEYTLQPDEGQDKLGMVIPAGLTVRRVAQLYGEDEKLDVIDVKSQEVDKRWTLRKWADYYESPGAKVIRNVISLEVSHSKLGRLIKRPRVVRDLDLQDDVWPMDEESPKVQFYCLMSVSDCYTDFHIDFGGSLVYYHIIKGQKTFFFLPPTNHNLKKYEQWNLLPSQNWTWFPDFAGSQCCRVDLYPGDTALIPSGWIHAVWTPEDSLVVGGNFLSRLNYMMHLRVVEIEKITNVPRKFRYPNFQKVMWYAVLRYLRDDPIPETVRKTLGIGGTFPRDVPIYLECGNYEINVEPGHERFNARYYSKAELDGLPSLVSYIFRTVMISLGKIEGIPTEVRKAVIKSIPKARYGMSTLEVAERFAIWVTWKRGNECIPCWVRKGDEIELGQGKVRKGRAKKNMKGKCEEKSNSIKVGEGDSLAVEIGCVYDDRRVPGGSGHEQGYGGEIHGGIRRKENEKVVYEGRLGRCYEKLEGMNENEEKDEISYHRTKRKKMDGRSLNGEEDVCGRTACGEAPRVKNDDFDDYHMDEKEMKVRGDKWSGNGTVNGKPTGTEWQSVDGRSVENLKPLIIEANVGLLGDGRVKSCMKTEKFTQIKEGRRRDDGYSCKGKRRGNESNVETDEMKSERLARELAAKDWGLRKRRDGV